MTKIFISYRRDDSSYIAGMINERLEKHFGPHSVFLDIDSIPLGLDFRKHIFDSVGQCNVLLALIGDSWINSTNDQGSRRLDDPTDFVRLEVESALKRDIPVIPVLVGKARMPSATELPSSLQELAFRNAAEVRAGLDLQEHLTRLVRGIDLLSKNNPTILESQQNDNDELIGKPATSKASTASAPASGENDRQQARWKMNNSQEVTSIDEFKQFTKFLQNLWGILAGISVLFPLSNLLLRLIPLKTFDYQEGVLVWISPGLFTTLTTLVSLFLVLWIFGQRQNFKSKRGRVGIRRQARISFVIGFTALVGYLIVYYFLLSSAYTVLGWVNGDIRHLIGEVPLLILYVAFFTLVTRAFMFLGMGEYFKSNN